MSAAKTMRQFAAELEATGCSIKMNTDSYQPGFTAIARRGRRRGRAVLVLFYRDADRFMYGYYHGRQVRSMTAIKRLLDA